MIFWGEWKGTNGSISAKVAGKFKEAIACDVNLLWLCKEPSASKYKVREQLFIAKSSKLGKELEFSGVRIAIIGRGGLRTTKLTVGISSGKPRRRFYFSGKKG